MNHSVPNTIANASGGSARKNESSAICDGCAAIAARLRSSTPVTSTVVVMRGLGDAEVELLGVGRAPCRAGPGRRGARRGSRKCSRLVGRRVDAWGAGERGGASTDDVHLDVVGVAVAAALVVDGEHVGVLLAEERRRGGRRPPPRRRRRTRRRRRWWAHRPCPSRGTAGTRPARRRAPRPRRALPARVVRRAASSGSSTPSSTSPRSPRVANTSTTR